MRPLAFLWLLALASALAGCSGSETVTVTPERRILTETVTVATTVQAEPAIFVPQSAGRPEYKPREMFTAVSGGGVRIDEWWLYGPGGLVIGLLALVVAGSGGTWRLRSHEESRIGMPDPLGSSQRGGD